MADASAEKAALVAAAKDFLASAKAFDGNKNARSTLAKKADNLRYLSEDGLGTVMRQFDAIHLTAALDVLTSTGALKALPVECTRTSKELADAANIDESAIQRAMRFAAAQGILEEVETDVWKHNAKSLAYLHPFGHHFFQVVLDQGFAFKQLARYFKTHTKEDLRDLRKCPYAFAHNMEGMTYYEVVSADPQRLETFNNTLAGMDSQLPILGMFPFASMKGQVEAEPNRPFIVDVGGGLGRVLMSIQEEAPAGFRAPIILQDRQDVIDAIPEGSIPHVTPMVHDFFTPNPVKNAHAYLLRRILHDFYEPECINIVKNIASAMGPTSRLLVGDFVLPEKTHVGDDLMVYTMDFSMMMLTGQEKSKEQFHRIFEAAGLEMVKIWPFEFGASSVVEGRLKQT